MNQTSPNKNPWFGRKTVGFGIGPRTWQGWLSIVLLVLIVSFITPITQRAHPSWFIAKTQGYGWDPITWQGWLITILPVVLFVLFIGYIYFKQRKN